MIRRHTGGSNSRSSDNKRVNCPTCRHKYLTWAIVRDICEASHELEWLWRKAVVNVIGSKHVTPTHLTSMNVKTRRGQLTRAGGGCPRLRWKPHFCCGILKMTDFRQHPNLGDLGTSLPPSLTHSLSEFDSQFDSTFIFTSISCRDNRSLQRNARPLHATGFSFSYKAMPDAGDANRSILIRNVLSRALCANKLSAGLSGSGRIQ